MVTKDLADTRTALAEEWARRSPSTAEEIAAFYRDSECLHDDLEAWHATPERQAWTRRIVAVAAANNVQRVLDVGAGTGTDLDALRAVMPSAGIEAVEPNTELHLAIARRGIAVATGIEYVEGQFDLVTCVDVLEHVADPAELLGHIIERVKVGGLLIEATATHDQSTPLHLERHADWMPDEALRSAGFVVVETDGRLAVWQRRQVVEAATVLLVSHRGISAPTVECLFGLVENGWPIALPWGDGLIDRARAKAVAHWYRDNDTDVFLMIDDDIVFSAEDAARVVALAREKRAIACGAYPVGGGAHMASRGWPGQELHWGPGREPVEIRWAATGFMAVHRDVIAALIEKTPECYAGEPDSFWPFFQPFAFEGNYLSEDYAFCERARQLGFATWMEPRVILTHLKLQALSVMNMPGAKVEQPR